ncbi:MAG: hypothetical protein Q7S00_08300, partial [bacterium]|nr:hypothetical protein [bacterium]
MKKILILSILIIFSACQKQPVVVNVAPGEPEVMAVFDGEKITVEDLKKSGSSQLSQAENELYDARKGVIDQIVEDKILEKESAQRKTTVPELLKKEVFDKVTVADPEVKTFYDQNKGRFQGKSFEEMKGQIQAMLRQRNQSEQKDKFVQGLLKKN